MSWFDGCRCYRNQLVVRMHVDQILSGALLNIAPPVRFDADIGDS